MLLVKDKSTQEKHLSQPLQTNNKQFNVSVTFLTCYNGIFSFINSNNKFYFMKSNSDEDGFFQRTTLPGAYEIESLNNEIKRMFIEEEYYTRENYPFTIQPNFSTLGSIIEISPQRAIISFMFDDSKRDLLGFHVITLYEEYNLSINPVDILSFDNIFLKTNIARGLIFKGK